jgi:putative transposase
MREDFLHKLTTRLANCYGIVGIEDVYIKGLMKNRKLARSFSDAALGKLLNLLTSKVEHQDGIVVKIDRFFPSTKSCHWCGWKWEDMELSDRIFLCQNPNCAYYQFPQDRDHNGGLNILYEALRLIGLLDQVVTGTGQGRGRKLGYGRGVRPKRLRP